MNPRRPPFDKHLTDDHFEHFDKQVGRTMAIATFLSIVGSLVFLALVIVGMYLALKHWG